ncbi:PLP-dependent aminotransferase family protein [Azospirillum sp. SYSU D00513]|uniref:aminotransferase-like domain-containing protein n=1 Tax=Azospirillum sp. SYSU D00513 TaxID=2812561 RepID=UPI001A96E1BA|nr:PLP-dependent aminotransferase family protein [Azospirillum sp. SYSU D00513]
MVAARFPDVVERLAADILDGTLAPGSRLPTHRELADRFGLAPATASRVYRELRRRGLTMGEVGRGTFVRGPARHNMDDLNESGIAAPLIDLSLNYPILDIQGDLMEKTLGQVALEGGWSSLLGYHSPAGRLRDRQAAGAWFASRGLHADPDEVFITAGSQHGLAVATAAVCGPGDTVAVESLTYPGFKILAGLQQIHLAPVEMDGEGLLPERLEELCRSRKLRALYLMPTVHNPLGTVMPPERRERVAAICRKHAVHILEDEAYGFLDDRILPSLRSLAPGLGFNIQSMGKLFAPGLRIGFMAAPRHLRDRIETVIRSTTWAASPIAAELASRWIEDGSAGTVLGRKRRDAAERQRLAASLLPGDAIRSHPTSYHLWLSLPQRVRADDFVRHLHALGVVVSPAAAFTPSSVPAPPALRLALGSPPVERLREGLRIVAAAYERFCR